MPILKPGKNDTPPEDYRTISVYAKQNSRKDNSHKVHKNYRETPKYMIQLESFEKKPQFNLKDLCHRRYQ